MRFTRVSLVVAPLITVVVGADMGTGLSDLEKKGSGVCLPLNNPCFVGYPGLCCSGKCESISVSVPQFPNVGLGKCVVSGQLSIPSSGYDSFHYQPPCTPSNGPCDLADPGACCSQTCINRGNGKSTCAVSLECLFHTSWIHHGFGFIVTSTTPLICVSGRLPLRSIKKASEKYMRLSQ